MFSRTALISRQSRSSIPSRWNEAVADCLVERYEELIESLQLPDLGDRHVLAAAIKCQADVIVTNNLRDFPKEVLGRFGIEAQSPDVFLDHLFDLNPTSFCSAVHHQRERLRNPRCTAEELLDIFYHQGLPLIVSKLREVADLLLLRKGKVGNSGQHQSIGYGNAFEAL